MKYILIILFSLCIAGCSNVERLNNPKYEAIHKLWRFKKDVSFKDTAVILHFNDRKISYLDLTKPHSSNFSFDDGWSYPSDYYIEGDTIFMQYHDIHAKYEIVEFGVKELGIVKFPANTSDLTKANEDLVEIIFEARE
jgi:hypothetical protein